MGKRSFDIIVAALTLAALSPLLLIVIAALRMTGEGEVFFRQERMGLGNQPFRVTKFATMLKSAANPIQGDYIVGKDPRILPLGRLLRATKINELPQLWDVLRGAMSLVGPRPQMLRVHALYPPEYALVLDRFRPGITGVGSIVFRDEETLLKAARNRDFCYTRQIVPYKAELEQWYAANQSFVLDLKLIALTVWHLLRPESQAISMLLPGNLVRHPASFNGIPE